MSRSEPATGAKSLGFLLLLVAGAVALLYLLPRGDWMLTREQRQGVAQEDDLLSATSGYDVHRMLFEIGSAAAYASGCGMKLNEAAVSTVLNARALKSTVFDADDPHHTDLVLGAQNVARLLAGDGGWAGHRSLTCSLAVAAYGKGGAVVPLLLSGSV